MLTKADDFPIHQRPDPIAKPGTDKNFYDRYFFNGYAREGRQFFALALGVYPNRNVIDASFCVIHNGIQHNLRASRHLGGERMDIHVGPISIEILSSLRLQDTGVAAVYGVLLMLVSATAFLLWGRERKA